MNVSADWLIIPGQRESLVGDIPAGDGKIANLFYSVPFGESAKPEKRPTAWYSSWRCFVHIRY